MEFEIEYEGFDLAKRWLFHRPFEVFSFSFLIQNFFFSLVTKLYLFGRSSVHISLKSRSSRGCWVGLDVGTTSSNFICFFFLT